MPLLATTGDLRPGCRRPRALSSLSTDARAVPPGPCKRPRPGTSPARLGPTAAPGLASSRPLGAPSVPLRLTGGTGGGTASSTLLCGPPAPCATGAVCPAEGRSRARRASPGRAAGAPSGEPYGRRQRPRLGAPASLVTGPCSTPTSPGLSQRLRVGPPPSGGGGPRSTSTIRPGCPRQPRLGALPPWAEGPRSTPTMRPGGPRPPRTGALPSTTEDPRSTSTRRPGGGGLSPTPRKFVFKVDISLLNINCHRCL